MKPLEGRKLTRDFCYVTERLPSTNLIDLNCEAVAPPPSQSRVHEYINDIVSDDTKTSQPRDVFDMRKYGVRQHFIIRRFIE